MTRQWRKLDDTFSRFDRIPACDRQTDRQTSCDSIVLAMHSIARLKSLRSCTKIGYRLNYVVHFTSDRSRQCLYVPERQGRQFRYATRRNFRRRAVYWVTDPSVWIYCGTAHHHHWNIFKMLISFAYLCSLKISTLFTYLFFGQFLSGSHTVLVFITRQHTDARLLI